MKDKLGCGKVGSHEIRIDATTFFGEGSSANARLEITPNPKVVVVKPKKIARLVDQVVLGFVDADGKPLAEIIDFRALTIDGQSIPWAQSQERLSPGQVKASRQYARKQVLVFQLRQGKHSVQVDAVIPDDKDVNGAQAIAQQSIEVKKSGQVFKLNLAPIR